MANRYRVLLLTLFAAPLCIVALAFLFFEINLVGTDPNPNRFKDLIAEFELEDSDIETQDASVIFVGSSSIRGWKIRESFPEIPALNRGMGGAELSDLIFFLDETVLKYDPKIVVVYAGENDVAGGKSPKTVLDDYHFFVDKITDRLAEVAIVYISIKPTPSKWKHWPKMRQANELVRAYSELNPNLHFVDIGEKMLGETNKVQDHLYANDGIHLSESGYQMWTENLRELLQLLYLEAISHQEGE